MFAPHENIWKFDLGKLVVPRVFMDLELLTTIAQNYNPIERIVKRVHGECLIRINVEEIKEVFGLEAITDYHEFIDF